MNSHQILNRNTGNHRSAGATGNGKASPSVGIALVAVLAGLAYVDFGTPHDGTSDQPPAGPAGRSAASAHGGTNGAQGQAAQAAPAYYLPAQYAVMAKSNDGNVATYEHD